MPINHRKKKTSCSHYKPLSDLPFSQAYNTPSCSHCKYFSSKNCLKSSADDLEDEYTFF